MTHHCHPLSHPTACQSRSDVLVSRRGSWVPGLCGGIQSGAAPDLGVDRDPASCLPFTQFGMDTDTLPRVITLTTGRTMVRRTRTAVLRVPYIDRNSDADSYHLQLLMLHILFRDEAELAAPAGGDPVEAFRLAGMPCIVCVGGGVSEEGVGVRSK